MDCQTCRENLSDFHEGGVDPSRADAIAAHLESCPECAQDYDRLTAVVSAVRSLDTIEPPPGMLENIKTALDEQDARDTRPSFVSRLAPAIAVAACLLLVVGVVIHQAGLYPGTPRMGTAAPVSDVVGDEYAGESDTADPTAPTLSPPAQEPADGETPQRPGVPEADSPPDGPRSAARAPDEGRSAGMSPPEPAEPVDDAAPPQSPPVEAPAGAMVAESPEPEAAETAADEPRGPSALSRGMGVRSRLPEAAYMEGADRSRPQPVMKSAVQPRPVQKLQARFIPPRTRQVGRIVTCAVEVDSATDIQQLSIRVETRNGLALPNAEDGYVFRGPVQAGETKIVEFRVRPRTAGTQRLRITLQTPDGQMKSQMEAALPGFVAAPRENVLDPLGEPVSVSFHETPVRHALLEVARKGQINLVLDTSEIGPRVTYSSENTPAGAVVRILAEEAGYSVEFQHDTYFVAMDD